MIRKAIPQDTVPLTKVALEAAERLYPTLRANPYNARKYITECISASAHFVWVSEDDDGIKGGMVAHSVPIPWAERRVCEVSYWDSSIKGDGVALLRAFKSWVATRPAIKVVRLLNDFGGERVSRVINKIGFPSAGTQHLLVR